MQTAPEDVYFQGKGQKKGTTFMTFLVVVVAAALGAAFGATLTNIYMFPSSALQSTLDYRAKALEYGQAVDDGVGWAGIIQELTDNDQSPWTGQVCMINVWNVSTIKAYAEWAKESFAQFPHMKSIDWVASWDPTSRNALVYAMWTGANTAGPNATYRMGTGGFVYMLHFNAADKVDSFTKGAWSALDPPARVWP